MSLVGRVAQVLDNRKVGLLTLMVGTLSTSQLLLDVADVQQRSQWGKPTSW